MRSSLFQFGFRTVQCWVLVAVSLLLWTEVAGADLVKRRVLSVYDSQVERTPSDTMVHLRAEMPLNHLGYIVDYVDVRKGLPEPDTLTDYAAVVTWLTYEMPSQAEYLVWIRAVSARDVPFIIFSGLGVSPTRQNVSLFNRVLRPMGIEYTLGYVETTFGTKVLLSDPEVVGFERPLDALLPSYPVVKRIAPDAAVAFEVEAPARERSAKSALVTAGRGGAFIAGEFTLYTDPLLNRTQWWVDPFEIFARVLSRRFPVPDTTTASGRRIYFSHVDGDGWNDTVDIERFQDPPVTAGELLFSTLVQPYPSLPVTVGLIGSDLDPVLGGGEGAADIARRMYSLPQVEAASHTMTAPLRWEFYENYSREAEEALMAGGPSGKNPAKALWDRLGLSSAGADNDAMRSQYLSGSRDLPRAYLRDPFSLEGEVQGSIASIETLLPHGKAASLYQWTGDARVFGEALKATKAAGLRNINGGGARFDELYPSVGYVTPIARTADGERQIYAVMASETLFTNNWSGNFGGLAELRATIERTEHPRRLAGVNVYYHAYSAKKQIAIDAIRGLLDWAREAEIAPITASNYAAIADGYFSTKIDEIAPTMWRISNRDGLQTVRFDDMPDFEIDLIRSVGVVGSKRQNGSLYVALDSAAKSAIVTLRPATASGSDHAVSLESGRWLVSRLERRDCGLTFDATGYGNSQLAWLGLKPGAYLATAARDAEQVWKARLQVGADGKLDVDMPGNAIEPVRISIECEASAS